MGANFTSGMRQVQTVIYSEFCQASDRFAGEITYAVIQQSR